MKWYRAIRKLVGIKGIKVLCLTILCALALYLTGATGAFFWTVFFTFLVFKIDSKYVGQATLICLVMLPLLLAVDKEAVAEQIAVYAFFLLTITVALQIAELKRDAKETVTIPMIDNSVQKISHVLDLRIKKFVLDLRHHKHDARRNQ